MAQFKKGDNVKVKRTFSASGKRFRIPTKLAEGTIGRVEEIKDSGDAIIMFEATFGYKQVLAKDFPNLKLIKGAVTCPNGHRLALVNNPGNQYNCNGCKRMHIPSREPLYGCLQAACDFDLCHACYTLEEGCFELDSFK